MPCSAIRHSRTAFAPPSIPATTCIPMMRAIAPWPGRSISGFSRRGWRWARGSPPRRAGDQDRPVMLGLAVAVEIVEALIGLARFQVAIHDDDLIAPALGQRHHLARGRDDAAMGQHVDTFLRSRL